MSSLTFVTLPPWAVPPDLLVHFGLGVLFGWIYFRSLWRSANRFISGDPIVRMIVTMLGRFVFLGGVLTLASLEGALPLLVMALGVLIARPMVMRRVRASAS